MSDAEIGLSQEALETLLQTLDPDPQHAARAYENLRQRLIKLFTWRRCTFPDALADDTLDRVARQLTSGLELRSPDPFHYIAGVAYRVFQETVRREIRERKTAREAADQTPAPRPEEVADQERNLTCLDRCLDALKDADRSLLLQFYEGEQGTRISARKMLAARLGVTRNALRIRACRLRTRLESCLRECLAKQA